MKDLKRGTREGDEAFEARGARALPIAAVAANRSRVPFLRFQFLCAGANSDVDTGGIAKRSLSSKPPMEDEDLPCLRLFISTDVAGALVGVGALGGISAPKCRGTGRRGAGLCSSGEPYW